MLSFYSMKLSVPHIVDMLIQESYRYERGEWDLQSHETNLELLNNKHLYSGITFYVCIWFENIFW